MQQSGRVLAPAHNAALATPTCAATIFLQSCFAFVRALPTTQLQLCFDARHPQLISPLPLCLPPGLPLLALHDYLHALTTPSTISNILHSPAPSYVVPLATVAIPELRVTPTQPLVSLTADGVSWTTTGPAPPTRFDYTATHVQFCLQLCSDW